MPWGRFRRRRAAPEEANTGSERPPGGLSSRPPLDGLPAGSDAPAGSRPRLADGSRLAAAARARFREDPEGALAELLGLARSFAPDPWVLHALCLSLRDAGQHSAALAMARDALPVCFRARQGLLAAEILEALDAEPAELGATREDLLALGGALAATSLWPLAVKALGAVVLRDPGDEKAVRGLERIAEHLERVENRAEAIRIYAFLDLVAGGGEGTSRYAERCAALERRASPTNGAR